MFVQVDDSQPVPGLGAMFVPTGAGEGSGGVRGCMQARQSKQICLSFKIDICGVTLRINDLV